MSLISDAPAIPAWRPYDMFDYDGWHTAVSTLREKQIFFVGGTIKSGTTWLQLLLDAHPQVSCKGEGHFLDLMAPALKMAMDQYGRFITERNQSVFNELSGYPQLSHEGLCSIVAFSIAVLLIEQSKHKNASAIGEKTPDNVRHFFGLEALFPTAKFLLIVRDGRDCAVSGWFHNLRSSPDWAKNNYGSLDAYARNIADTWAAELAKAQEFVDRHADRTRQLRFEDLVTNTEDTLAGVFEFLGVKAPESILTQCRSQASFVNLSGGRRPGEEDRRSFFRKGVPGDWRNHLSDKVEAEFRERAGNWLDRFGYS
jgi:hypothetical protein